jgi:hypothetical protein
MLSQPTVLFQAKRQQQKFSSCSTTSRSRSALPQPFASRSALTPLQVKACGAVTKANAAKDGAASRSQSAPAAAGTGKKIAGHSGGDGDPMVFAASLLQFLRSAHVLLG